MSTFFQLHETLSQQRLQVQEQNIQLAPGRRPQSPSSAMLLNPFAHLSAAQPGTPRAANDDSPAEPKVQVG